LALIDKPASRLGEERELPIPVVTVAELDEHRRVPSVNARLARVEAMAKAGTGSQPSGSAK
jgi:hypothetical protein